MYSHNNNLDVDRKASNILETCNYRNSHIVRHWAAHECSSLVQVNPLQVLCVGYSSIADYSQLNTSYLTLRYGGH